MNVSGKRVLIAFVSIVSIAAIVGAAIPSHSAYAANITSRSLTLEGTGNVANDINADGIPDGGSMPGATVNHLFTFTLPTSTTVNSISFEYCTTADVDIGGTCTPPTGLNVSGATLGTSSGDGTGFDTIHVTSNNDLYLSSTGGVNPTNTSSTIELDGVVNQDATNCGGSANCTFFVRITTYTSSDATTGATDAGTVTASTSTQIILTGTMPESLIFCTGGHIDISATSGLPDCSTASSGSVSFNQLFSPTGSTWATSQFAASTNAGSGYVVTVNGPTLASGGSNTITAIGATAAASAIGTAQFGMNLVDDSADPTIGSSSTNPITYYNGDSAGTGGAVNPVADGVDYKGQPKANFDTASSYAFHANNGATVNNNIIAASDNGGAGPTDSQRFTSTYIVNVPGNQPAGTYTTTLTYICTPTF
ncbi:MAG TPA: hypothetical protein VHD60_01245 [Candidatus Saccharimonadales bacterium]|nr:hypothetical protein [Candidatus Saccharimonadales bacterium]